MVPPQSAAITSLETEHLPTSHSQRALILLYWASTMTLACFSSTQLCRPKSCFSSGSLATSTGSIYEAHLRLKNKGAGVQCHTLVVIVQWIAGIWISTNVWTCMGNCCTLPYLLPALAIWAPSCLSVMVFQLVQIHLSVHCHISPLRWSCRPK